MDFTDFISMWLMTALVTCLLTWSVANSVTSDTIATECDKLGAFYVGDVVYECKRTGE